MSDAELAMLRKGDFLSRLDDATLLDVAAVARRQRFSRDARIVSELEFGADVFVIVSGEAEVSVEPRQGERQRLRTIGAGTAVGEMSSVTGELRSATVTAITDVDALVIDDAFFDRLRERRPEIAVSLVRILATRLAKAEQALDALFAQSEEPPSRAIAGEHGVRRSSMARVWRELVVNHQRDLAFLTLAAFVGTLLVIRLVVYASFRFDLSPRIVLRAAYISGFSLLLASSCAALLTFRPWWRRAISICFGVGCALILNELGVTRAFDIFYKDIQTPDPNAPFDIERLYRRTEGLRAIVIGLVILVQAAYLRPFYRRVAFVLMTRLRRFRT